MAAKVVKKVTEVPGLNEVFGVKADTVPFAPVEIFDQLKIPEKWRFEFKLKPLSEGHRSEIMSLLSALNAQVLRYVNDEGLAPHLRHYGKNLNDKKLGLTTQQKKDALYAQEFFHKKMAELDPRERKYAIIQQYVVGVKNYFTVNADNDLVKASFKKEPGQDYMETNLWQSIPPKIKESIYNRILQISNITSMEIASL